MAVGDRARLGCRLPLRLAVPGKALCGGGMGARAEGAEGRVSESLTLGPAKSLMRPGASKPGPG